MQDTDPMPWGALDRFQAHYIVLRESDGDDSQYLAKTVLETAGRFGSKTVSGVSWSGGRLADILNSDEELARMIKEQSVHDAQIFVEPTDTGVRIHGRWRNQDSFGVSRPLFEIYDRIAGHIRTV